MKKVGVLALQGNYYQHKQMLDKLQINNVFVKYPEQLHRLDALIIPGGESSVISKLIEKNNFRQPIVEFSKFRAIFGTCAGMVLLSSTKENSHLIPLNIMEFTIQRNAWGRQIDSFSDNISLNKNNDSFVGYFIRSPKIKTLGKKIKVLGQYKDEPVILTDGRHMVCSFHPEMGNDFRIYKYFIESLNEK